jgi:hypothetical protein
VAGLPPTLWNRINIGSTLNLGHQNDFSNPELGHGAVSHCIQADFKLFTEWAR